MATYYLSVRLHWLIVGSVRQCDDYFANGTGNDSIVRSDGIESRSGSYFHGHFFEYRRYYDTSGRLDKQ